MQPQKVSKLPASTSIVAQASPSGQLPPHKLGAGKPPVSSHGTTDSGAHSQEPRPRGFTVQTCPTGHSPWYASAVSLQGLLAAAPDLAGLPYAWPDRGAADRTARPFLRRIARRDHPTAG